jgi:predicted nucleic acid-binding Zn ribbon protein
MAKCPHCGETVAPGQERCFACGQLVRSLRRGQRRPVSGLLFVAAGLAVLVAVVAFIVVASQSGRKAAAERERAELERVQDSVRAANRAMRDTARLENQDDATRGLIAELGEIEARFNRIKRDVVKGQPSAEQQRIISQFGAELGRARQLAAALGDLPPARQDSIKVQLREAQRQLRTLTSALPRAPR